MPPAYRGLASSWVVDPVAGTRLALRLTPSGAYEVEADLAAGGILVTERPFAVTFKVSRLAQG